MNLKPKSLCLLAALAVSGTAVLSAAQTAAPAAPATPAATSTMKEEEAIRILTDSPWAKKVQVTVLRPMAGSGPGDDAMGSSRRGGGGMAGSDTTALGGGDGMSANLPANGMGEAGGGGGRRGGGGRAGGATTERPSPQLPPITLRWESALPVRQALAAMNRQLDVAASQEHSAYYSICALIRGFRMGQQDPEKVSKMLREKATLKIKGKKVQPERVDISARADGAIVYFLFPRSQPIGAEDKDVEFTSQIGMIEIKTKFHPKEMMYAEKLEL